MEKAASLSHFAGVSPSRSPEGLSEQRARNRVYATRRVSIPKDCILSITVFHVTMVLTQRRRGRRRVERELYILSAMFFEGLWKVRNLESSMRNSQPFQMSHVGAYYIVSYNSHYNN